MRLIASFLPYDPIRDKIKKTIISLNIYLPTNTYICTYMEDLECIWNSAANAGTNQANQGDQTGRIFAIFGYF
jgi:hypothetical protein